MTPLDACDRSAELLRGAGFVFVRASMKSTSCYYALPGYVGTIRVSTHSRKRDKRPHSSGPVVAHVTFPRGCKQFLTESSVLHTTACGVGHFMLKAKREVIS